MARNESQGLQIAVILLTMCVVGLAVATWVFYQSADKNFKLAEGEKNNAKAANDAKTKEEYKATAYGYILGVPDATKAKVDTLKGSSGGDAAVEKTVTDYEAVAKANEKAFSGESRPIAQLPVYLNEGVGERNKQLTAAADRETTLGKEKVATEQREQGRAKTAEEGMAKAAADLTAERENFNRERADHKKKQDEMVAQIAAKDKQLKDQKEQNDKEIASFTTRIDELGKENNILLRKLAQTTKDGPSFEAPDGQITWVSQRQRTAWIDVGYADGLMRQTTFSVYDHDENGVTSATRKARLEVVRVTEPHLAECKILDDEIRNPILPGDKIFTPAWSPGQHLHFALSGNIDIDGDGKPDNDEVKNIVQLNGGTVDAEVTPAGKRSGSVTEQTRYLIRGKAPLGDDEEQARAAYTEMTKQAETSGTEIIDVSRFLAMMGWKAQERTTPLGNKRTGRRSEKAATPATDAKSPMEEPDAATDEPDAKADAPAAPAKPADDDNPFD